MPSSSPSPQSVGICSLALGIVFHSANCYPKWYLMQVVGGYDQQANHVPTALVRCPFDRLGSWFPVLASYLIQPLFRPRFIARVFQRSRRIGREAAVTMEASRQQPLGPENGTSAQRRRKSRWLVLHVERVKRGAMARTQCALRML